MSCTAQNYFQFNDREADEFQEFLEEISMHGLSVDLKRWVIASRDRLDVSGYNSSQEFAAWVIRGFSGEGSPFTQRIGACIKRQSDRSKVLTDMIRRSYFAPIFFSDNGVAPPPPPAGILPSTVVGIIQDNLRAEDYQLLAANLRSLCPRIARSASALQLVQTLQDQLIIRLSSPPEISNLVAAMNTINPMVADKLRALVSAPPSSGLQSRPRPTSMIGEVEKFFRSEGCKVDSSVEYDTIATILQKTANTPILQALRVGGGEDQPNSVVKFLESYPTLCPLVAIALFRSGHAVLYSRARSSSETGAHTIIQLLRSEEELADGAVENLIRSFNLKTLANLPNLSPNPAAENEANWRVLCCGVTASAVKNLLVTHGKSRSELDLWSIEKLMSCLGDYSGNGQENPPYQNYHYKIAVLKLLREGSIPAPDVYQMEDRVSAAAQRLTAAQRNIIPWLSTAEFMAWLNPPRVVEVAVPVREDRMQLDLEEPAVVSSPNSIEGFLRQAGVVNPEFVGLCQSNGLELEHLGLVIEGFGDPDLAPIRSKLSLAQRLSIKAALNSAAL